MTHFYFEKKLSCFLLFINVEITFLFLFLKRRPSFFRKKKMDANILIFFLLDHLFFIKKRRKEEKKKKFAEESHTEEMGFEPMVQKISYADLANQCLQPLSHSSIFLE